MSRAPSASFAQFFPSAPRAAKDKAKEREKSRSQIPDSSAKPRAADSPLGPSQSRAEDAGSIRSAGEGNIRATDSAALPTEENASPPGDILNGVGSASSYASTISSASSAPAQPTSMSTFGSAPNVSSLTPLTTIDSSPNPAASPNPDKQINASGYMANRPSSQDDAPDTLRAPAAMAGHEPSDTRIHARDPARGIKGAICTYDPILDRKMGSNDKKKAKPIYKEFGLVRIHNLLGSVILLLRVTG
jgi:histone-lysine N-methyltransferase SETD1